MSVLRYLDTEELEIRNPLFLVDTEVNASSGTDNRDIGIVGKYYDGTNLVYGGLFRDATDAHFKVFQGLQTLPLVDSGSVDTAAAGYTLASLDTLNLHATGTFTVDGTLTANSDLITLGSVSILDVSTLTVEDNIVLANSGPANQLSDAGFCTKRPAANIVADDAVKEFGTASAAGTTTTITLQAANGHGTALDYYKGWSIKLAGDVTGTASITDNTAADPPTLTLDTAASGPTSTSTTYQLFNKTCVGMIHDESTGMITAYGFPREDTMGIIDLAGDAGNGNLADFIDFKANNITAANNLSVSGSASVLGPLTLNTIDANILSVNDGPNNLGSTGGYVSQRTPLNIVANDVAELTAVAIQTAYVSGSKTLLITNAATGSNYFRGWIVRYKTDTTEPTYVVSSTVAAGVHTLTLSTSFSIALTTSDTVDLYNKRYVGAVYSETDKNVMLVGFPTKASVIDVTAPINGNIPTYIDLTVQDLDIKGTLTIGGSSGSLQLNTATFVGDVTFTASDILSNDAIYLNPTADATYTLPSVASLALAADKSKKTRIINISSFVATVVSDAADTIEGLGSLNLSNLYSKTTLTASSEVATAWLIS
jgi:hypothetical protein